MILEWGPGSGSPCWRRPKSTNSCPAAARPPPTALRTPSDGPSWRPTSSTAWVLSPRWVLQKEMSDPSVGLNGRILTELPTYPIKKNLETLGRPFFYAEICGNPDEPGTGPVSRWERLHLVSRFKVRGLVMLQTCVSDPHKVSCGSGSKDVNTKEKKLHPNKKN